jgi:hypothetical protein
MRLTEFTNHYITEEDLPDYDLQSRYQHYNRLVWDGQLPEIRLMWATLKGLGGYANAKVGVDPSKPSPNPLRVRLGLEDKYSNRFIMPGSIYIKISGLYKRSETSLDKILLHEMIHVHLMVTGHLGEGHGRLFFDELRRVSKIVGFDVPREDTLERTEFASEVKVKPLGVILINDRNGFRYNVYSANLVQNQLDVIRKRYESYAQLKGTEAGSQQPYATVYLIADKMWSEKAMRMPVQRKLGYGSYRMTDSALLDDLRSNGKVLAEI